MPRETVSSFIFTEAIFAWHCVLSDHPPVLWWLSPGEEWDAVTRCGWDKLWKGRNYWKSRRRCQVYGLLIIIIRMGCMLDDCVCVCYLTWHDYPSLVVGESLGILLLFCLGNDRPSILFFLASFTSFHTHAFLFTFFCLLVLFHSCCTNALVFGKALVPEFHISSSHTECYLLICDSAITCAQETFEERYHVSWLGNFLQALSI